MSLHWTLDPSGILLDVTHSRRTTQKRQIQKILDMVNSRGTTLNACNTYQQIPKAYTKYNKSTIQQYAVNVFEGEESDK